MAEGNKSYRIRTNVGQDSYLNVQLDQDYDVLEILSLKINENNAYRLHTSDYGVVVGRVLANGGFGVPNAKISVFIPKENNASLIESLLYPYTDTQSVDENDVRYNLLPGEQVESCHNPVGTFASKRFMLDNDEYIEIFETYYKYSTKTNDAGDYMIFGVPTGQQTLHMDLDISDCGMLSQRPRDFIYKGYSIEQFENANQFKTTDDLDSLPQIFTQNKTIDVKPFWGDAEERSIVGITRADIDVNFKFESTCIFIGSIFSDDKGTGLSPRCTPSKAMGKMSDLATGSGRIEMIRKKDDGTVEEFQIKGTELIDGNGVWCYQIPMNLDYMVTDEYGNLVATDNPEKGIATRCRVRFRISAGDDTSGVKYFQAKVLVPNNPKSSNTGDINNLYEFGTLSPEDEFRDLFWNNVYSVKSYIPRLQMAGANPIVPGYKKFLGIKTVNKSDGNNPIPYNHIRLKFPFLYTIVCAVVNFVLTVVKFLNKGISIVEWIIEWIRGIGIDVNWADIHWHPFGALPSIFSHYITLGSKMCEQLDGTFVAPGAPRNGEPYYGDTSTRKLIMGTYKQLYGDEYHTDSTTIAPVSPSPQGYKIDLKDNDNQYWGFVTGTSINAFTVYYFTDGSYERVPGSQQWAGRWIDAQFSTGYGYAGKQISTSTITGDERLLCKIEYDGVSGKISNMWGGLINPASSEDSRFPTYSMYGDEMAWDKWVQTLRPNYFNNYPPVNNGGYYPEYSRNNAGYCNNNRLAVPIFGPFTTYDNIKDYLEKQGVVSPNKYEDSAEVEGQEEVKDTDSICLTSDGDFLLQCIEMALAEDYEVINFDFYNDWLNGTIYMPRWARITRRGFFNGKRVTKSCSTDTTNSKRRLSIGNMNGTTYNVIGDSYTAAVTGTDAKTWRINGRVLRLKQKEIIVGVPSKVTGAKAYYLKSIDGNGQLFKTDIILLGSLNECNLYGIPMVSENLPSTTYQMPADLAQTTYQNDEQGTSWGQSGCMKVDDIAHSGDYNAFWNNYIGADTGHTENLETDDSVYWMYTEEAGISWNYTGPNQLTSGSSIDHDKRLYSPGGHFLGLACGGLNSKTNFRSNVNLLRACEYGVSLSQRLEIPGYYKDNKVYDYYLVPNGLISKDSIYDNSYRAQFATMNHTGLATELDENTGYLRYRFEYMYPNNFDGIFDSRFADHFNGQVVVTAHTDSSDVKSTSEEIMAESGDTYSRIQEKFNRDYARFRYGNDYNARIRYNGWQQLMEPNNSYYFYFGLKEGQTAVDALRKDFFAVCERSVENEYPGTIEYWSGYTNDDRNQRYFWFKTEDVTTPLTISLINQNSEELIDENNKQGILKVTNDEIYPKTSGECFNSTTGLWKDDIIKNLHSASTNNITAKTFGILVDDDEITYVLSVISNEGYALTVNFDIDATNDVINDYSYRIETNLKDFRCTDGELSSIYSVTGEDREQYYGYYSTTIPLDAISAKTTPFERNWKIKFNDVFVAEPGRIANNVYKSGNEWHIPITSATANNEVSVEIYHDDNKLTYSGKTTYTNSYPTLWFSGKSGTTGYTGNERWVDVVNDYVINNLMQFKQNTDIIIHPFFSGGSGVTVYLYAQPERGTDLYSGVTLDSHVINVNKDDKLGDYTIPDVTNSWMAYYPTKFSENEVFSVQRNNFEIYAIDNVRGNKPMTNHLSDFTINDIETSEGWTIATVSETPTGLSAYTHYVLYNETKKESYPAVIKDDGKIAVRGKNQLGAGDKCSLYNTWLIPIYYRPQKAEIDIVIGAIKNDNDGKYTLSGNTYLRYRLTHGIYTGAEVYNDVTLTISGSDYTISSTGYTDMSEKVGFSEAIINLLNEIKIPVKIAEHSLNTIEIDTEAYRESVSATTGIGLDEWRNIDERILTAITGQSGETVIDTVRYKQEEGDPNLVIAIYSPTSEPEPEPEPDDSTGTGETAESGEPTEPETEQGENQDQQGGEEQDNSGEEKEETTE